MTTEIVISRDIKLTIDETAEKAQVPVSLAQPHCRRVSVRDQDGFNRLNDGGRWLVRRFYRYMSIFANNHNCSITIEPLEGKITFHDSKGFDSKTVNLINALTICVERIDPGELAEINLDELSRLSKIVA